MNLKFLKVKTRLQIQIEDYIAWKKARGVNDCMFESLSKFTNFIKREAIEDIKLEDIQNFYNHINVIENTKFFISLAMKDVRVMFRWFKARKYNVIDPNVIGEEGLTNKIKDAILENMTETKRMGRPPKVELIKKVKSLRDVNKLSFREIARVIRKDVSQVYVWYNYDLQ